MSNRRKIAGRDAAQALGRLRTGQGLPGDAGAVEDAMGGDLALLVHCLRPDGPVTLVIGVTSWAHAGACIASPAIADDLGPGRKVFEVVPMREAHTVPNPLAPG